MAIALLNSHWRANHPIVIGKPKDDDPAWSLAELNILAPDGKGYRRFQIIKVLRGRHVMQYRRDLGDEKSFKSLQFCIPGGVQEGDSIEILHTVGQLMEYADQQRESLEKRPQPKPSNLAQQWVDEEEWKMMLRKGQKSFMLGGV